MTNLEDLSILARGVQYQRRFRRLLAQYERGDISLEVMTAWVQGWVNHVHYANTVGLRKKLLGGTVIPLPRHPHEAEDDPT